jgi:lipid II:glycine glycyltransferase (peptidoglycan interpeptide bridge formation enzyme)
MARLLLAKYNGNTISGAIILYYKDTVYAWDLGWRREYGRIAPNDLLTWEIARSASQNGYKYFDLLRVEPDRLPGVARWKIAFGGDTVSCYRLDKATMGYQLQRVLRFAADPRRLISKARSLLAGRDDA